MRALVLLLLLACRPTTTGTVGDSSDESGSPPQETGEVPLDLDPRAVVLFIGDGMGYEHVKGGGLYANGESGTLHMESMPWAGRMRTASLSGYTDSAAAATVMATGHKTYNAYLGLNRDQQEVASVLEEARALGLSTGVVTTDQLTGATPSAFQTHVLSRYDTDSIVLGWLEEIPDVALGGGASNLEPGMSKLDVQLIRTPEELMAVESDGRPLVGLFAASTFPYVFDSLAADESEDPVEDVPSLAEMVDTAISLLSENEEGFFLVVEGARIDHASHSNSTAKVHLETAAFDEAVAVALNWADQVDSQAYETTILVTADHECGGMEVVDASPAGEPPETEWRWTDHTNADVPVFGYGDRAQVLDGDRLDNSWIHAVLSAAIEQRDVEAPDVPRLVDGWTEDLGGVISQQIHTTSFGEGFNQLDGLRLAADSDGLWVGVDGVFEWEDNAVVVLIDLDYPQGTGLLASSEVVLSDTEGTLDSLLSSLDLSTELDGLGFDLALASMGAREIRDYQLNEEVGLRGFHSSWGEADDLWWLASITNFDDGNISKDGAAQDAGETGATEGGYEALMPWSSVYKDGMPEDGTTVAASVILVNSTGQNGSNQALPPYADGDEPGVNPLLISEVATLTVDGEGVQVD